MFRVARGGANWVITPLALAIITLGLAGPLGMPWLVSASLIPFSIFLFMLTFFRDPERSVAPGIVSPADGKVVRIDQVDDPDIGPADRIAIFMGPTNVHVNRAPTGGDVRSVTHTPGGHIPAFSKDSERNERVATIIASDLGDIKVIQIAGAVARRIFPYAQKGDHIHTGERMGLIRLGSRCDVLIPRGTTKWTVEVGDKVRGASSRIAEETE